MIDNVLLGISLLCGGLALALGISYGVGLEEKDWQTSKLLRPIFIYRKRLLGPLIAIALLAFVSENILSWRESKRALEPTILPNGQYSKKSSEALMEMELNEINKDKSEAALAYFKAGEIDFARQRYPEALENYRKSVSETETMSAFLNAGSVAYYLAKFAVAETCLLSGLKLAELRAHRHFQSTFLANLGNVYAESKRPDLARHAYEKSLFIDKATGDSIGQSWSLNAISTLLVEKDSLIEASRLSRLALELLRGRKKPIGIEYIYGNLGDIFFASKLLDGAIIHYDSAYNYSLTNSNEWGIALSLLRRGICLAIQGKTKLAITHFQDSYARYQRIGNPDQKAEVFYALSLVFLQDGIIDSSRKYYNAAIAINPNMKNSGKIAEGYELLGSDFVNQANYDRAYEAFHRALRIRTISYDTLRMAENIYNLGVIYGLRRVLDSADAYFTSAKDLFAFKGNAFGQARCFRGLGKVQLDQGKKQEARLSLAMAMALFREAGPSAGEELKQIQAWLQRL